MYDVARGWNCPACNWPRRPENTDAACRQCRRPPRPRGASMMRQKAPRRATESADGLFRTELSSVERVWSYRAYRDGGMERITGRGRCRIESQMESSQSNGAGGAADRRRGRTLRSPDTNLWHEEHALFVTARTLQVGHTHRPADCNHGRISSHESMFWRCDLET